MTYVENTVVTFCYHVRAGAEYDDSRVICNEIFVNIKYFSIIRVTGGDFYPETNGLKESDL